MNINYELYRIFYNVAMYKSISRAAQALYISQPAVTQAIQNLEKNLGGTLFVRGRKGCTLTLEGEILFSYVKKGIENFQNGENAFLNAMNLDSGIIRIGGSTTVLRYVVSPCLKKFHKKYPKVDIQIVSGLTKDLVRMLKNGDLDLVVCNLPMVDTINMKIIPIRKVHDAFVCDKQYSDLIGKSIILEELIQYPLITQKSPSNTRSFLDKYLKDNNIVINPQVEAVSYGLVVDFAKSGFGIGYITKEFLNNELENKELFEIKVKPDIPEREIGIVLLENGIPNYSSQKLIELLKDDGDII